MSFPNKLVGAKYKQSASVQAEPNTEREMTSASMVDQCHKGPIILPADKLGVFTVVLTMSLKTILISKGMGTVWGEEQGGVCHAFYGKR